MSKAIQVIQPLSRSTVQCSLCQCNGITFVKKPLILTPGWINMLSEMNMQLNTYHIMILDQGQRQYDR